MNKAKNPVKAVVRSIEIIEVLQSASGATLDEITRDVDLTKGSVHNHLRTLCEHGFATFENNQYRIGLRFFELGEQARSERKVYELAINKVNMLGEETGELASLLVEENGRGIYLYRSHGDEALQLDTKIGSSVELHTTGLGKAILAFYPSRRTREIIEQEGLRRATSHTITGEASLSKELEKIRERGFAIDREERTKGVSCIAAPIRTNSGEVLGAVSVAGPVGRMGEARIEADLSELVTNAAEVIGINATHT